MTEKYICPICGKPLSKAENSLKCSDGHCFDISKSGYVNLLSGKGKKGHGDDKIMVKARHDFLYAEYYNHLKSAICEEIKAFAEQSVCMLDSGCGEGYYTKDFYAAFTEKGDKEVYGIDVSKEALKIASRSCPKVNFAVASAYKLPFSDNSFDLLTSLFAPLAVEEFYRVLDKKGIFITAIPLENHLFSLKKAVYDTPYRNKPENTQLAGFRLIKSKKVTKDIALKSNEDIKNLFMMTPYYYKTSEKDQKKLDIIDKLVVETEFMVLIYRKTDK